MFIIKQIDMIYPMAYDNYHHAIVYYDDISVKRLSLDSWQITDIIKVDEGNFIDYISCNNRGDIVLRGWYERVMWWHLCINNGPRYIIPYNGYGIRLHHNLLITDSPFLTDIPGFNSITMPTHYTIHHFKDMNLLYTGYNLILQDFTRSIIKFTGISVTNQTVVDVDYYDNIIIGKNGKTRIYNSKLEKLALYHISIKEVFGKYHGYWHQDELVLEPLPYIMWSPNTHKFYSRFHQLIITILTLNNIVEYCALMPLELWSLIFSEL